MIIGSASSPRWFARLCGIIMLAAISTPSAAQTLVPQAQAPQARAEYRLNAGDTVEVFVWGEERMQRDVKVLPDGTVSFPLAGTIQAEGRTSRDVAAEIQRRIQTYYRAGTPEVTVSVKDTSGMRFYVIGKVRSPGSYSIGRAINALQALTLAGGPAEFADVDNAVILRETATGQIVEKVSMSEVLKGGRRLGAGRQAETIPLLRSGDVLVIP